MIETKKNPIIAGIISVFPAILNSVISLVKDKKKNKAGESDVTNVVHEDIAGGVSISAKRVMNLVGTGIIISTALTLITANGLTKLNIILLGIGVVYSLGMSLITYFSERK